MAKLFVDDASVSIKEACLMLDIDPNAIPMNKARILEVDPNRVLDQNGNPRKDFHGNIKLPRRIGMDSKFNVYVPSKQKSFLVRYVTTAQPDAKIPGKTNYLPSQVFIDGGIEDIKEDILFFYMYIYPQCFNSPFRKVNDKWRFMYRDNEAKAKKELEEEEWYIKSMSIIMGEHALPMDQLRKIAKGMGVGNADTKTDSEIKSELRVKAKANPGQFWMDARSRDILFGGMVQDGIDKNIFKVIVSSGVKHWYMNNREICAIGGGANEVNVLKNALLAEPDLITELNELLESKDKTSVLSSSKLDNVFNSFITPDNVAPADVSPNIHKSNLDLIKAEELKERVKKLAEAEDKFQRDNITMHHNTVKSLEKHRDLVDEYKRSEEYLGSLETV